MTVQDKPNFLRAYYCYDFYLIYETDWKYKSHKNGLFKPGVFKMDYLKFDT